ncbi:class I SAM-dependent methyltransferase [Microbacterium sp. LWH3-1.2]|uniref:class I SAM-dependent methyltransferase n=1 Tax=Microbacterium sp. LWH3-1.2 TaxID=3135256 RepID=UPI003435528A
MAAPIESSSILPDAPARPFWLTPASYWLPAHYPVSAWTSHAPFAAWLTDTLRPSEIVELGTHFGFSCFAFAEAARRLGMATTIHALDSWKGDDHAGFYSSDVYEYVRTTASADYPDSVRLERGYFHESRRRFGDGFSDVLHIDGRHGYEDVREDYSDWIGVVRDGGVVLFHDIAERENGFGVWRLWEELAEPGRSFTFHHGHGLGVLAVGTVTDGRLGELFTADETTADRVRADFVRLGERVQRQAWLESLPAELEEVWAEVRQRAAHEAALEEALQGSSAHIAELKSSTSWRVTAPLRAAGRVVHRRR